MADYADVVEGGIVVIKPWKDLPKGASRAVQKIKERRSLRADNTGDGDETIIDVQMELGHHDKLEALDMLIKLKGFDKPASEDTDKLDQLLEVLKSGPVKRNGA